MNIFLLSKYYKNNARYHNDKHLRKMIIEYAQLLCSAHIILDSIHTLGNIKLYKLTHKNHPCSIWVRTSRQNYLFLYKLFKSLCEEYVYRFDKIHLTCKTFGKILQQYPKNIQNIGLTPFVNAMPKDLIVSSNAIINYRNYYNTNKRHIAKWTKRDIPYWYNI